MVSQGMYATWCHHGRNMKIENIPESYDKAVEWAEVNKKAHWEKKNGFGVEFLVYILSTIKPPSLAFELGVRKDPCRICEIQRDCCQQHYRPFALTHALVHASTWASSSLCHVVTKVATRLWISGPLQGNGSLYSFDASSSKIFYPIFHVSPQIALGPDSRKGRQ